MTHEPADWRLPAQQTLSGRTVAGRYQVLGLLGQGGIGKVYVAEQIGLDRRVALKVIRPDRRTDAVTAQRFAREARAAGRIHSPHVVTLFDFGSDRGEHYIAMEKLEGESLLERLSRGPQLPLTEALRIAADIAKGLRAAHEAGVLHRDLKPANVFLCEDGTVKVLDFGIAKLVDDEDEWEPLTGVNRVLGTPVYMSPEAATRKPLGPTTDLYALGLLIFEMIVGEPPFKTGDPMETLRAQVTRPAPRLRQAAPWAPVPAELDLLVSALLEKDPKERPRDAGAVAGRLETIAADLRRSLEVTKTEIDLPRLSAARVPDELGLLEDDDLLDDGAATEVWRGRPMYATDAPAVMAEPVVSPRHLAYLTAGAGMLAFAASLLLRLGLT